ncbi:hypothetical protein SAMN05216359_101136 [Roseateles sp. YR242]|uniref:hypothetical protein n=1 Tax=Roseateles sp. YR242 TaxID=1855305 RepID=UPI0008D3B872|nr:hypothetical protein [Roseateles sp. YR242]SEK23991.1 hypothetical protein SAMN05216359_101136 [Roseateles sp. YR242]
MPTPLISSSDPKAHSNAIDNLLRRELKVGDPSDPTQIARALADRYQASPRAQAIDGESRGLPFLQTPIVRPTGVQTQTASDIDLEQARSDVEADMTELLRSTYSKDIRPELEGWQNIIQRSIDEGVACSRMGLDPQRRDTAFAMRRQLGEYARLSRLIGALEPELNRNFRALALSLDEVSAVLLVLMGESMANIGFSGGRFLLQVSYAELQARRDAVLNALRLVDGSGGMSAQPGTWPRGLRAYRTLSQQFEANGQGDLRSLMSESEMSRTLDQLVQLASGGTPYGLRSIGASAWAPINRLYRFVQITLQPVARSSPELAALHEAMMLFLGGFAQAGGFRLLRVARPTVLNYGLYGSSTISRAELRLMELVNLRGSLARVLDNLTQCACDENRVLTQSVLDSILFSLDRAIDYYCVGNDTEDFGVPEARAAAYSLLLDTLLPNSAAYPLPGLGSAALGATQNWPWQPTPTSPAIPRPAYLGDYVPPNTGKPQPITDLLDNLRGLLRPRPTGMYLQAAWWESGNTQTRFNRWVHGDEDWTAGGGSGYSFGRIMKEELALIKQTDQEWRSVVSQMTTGYISMDRVFHNPGTPSEDSGCLSLMVDRAIGFLSAATAGIPNAEIPFDSSPTPLRIPPHYEESLEVIALKP